MDPLLQILKERGRLAIRGNQEIGQGDVARIGGDAGGGNHNGWI